MTSTESAKPPDGRRAPATMRPLRQSRISPAAFPIHGADVVEQVVLVLRWVPQVASVRSERRARAQKSPAATSSGKMGARRSGAGESASRPDPQEASHAQNLDDYTQLAYDGLSVEFIEASLFTQLLRE